MQVTYFATDRDGFPLFAQTIDATDWRDACRVGMTMRGMLAKDGIRVDWRKLP